MARLATDDDVGALPLHIVAGKGPSRGVFAILFSGDGGWASIDKRIASRLADSGVSVVGVDSRAYLLEGRTPEAAGADVARIIRAFSARWAAPRVAIAGYSRGADMVPFIANRLPADVRQAVALVALLGPAERTTFEFHWTDLIRNTARPGDVSILPELERLRGTPVLCVYGREERESLCHVADSSVVRIDRRDGGHHFDENYEAIAVEILSLLLPSSVRCCASPPPVSAPSPASTSPVTVSLTASSLAPIVSIRPA